MEEDFHPVFFRNLRPSNIPVIQKLSSRQNYTKKIVLALILCVANCMKMNRLSVPLGNAELPVRFFLRTSKSSGCHARRSAGTVRLYFN